MKCKFLLPDEYGRYPFLQDRYLKCAVDNLIALLASLVRKERVDQNLNHAADDLKDIDHMICCIR